MKAAHTTQVKIQKEDSVDYIANKLIENGTPKNKNSKKQKKI